MIGITKTVTVKPRATVLQMGLRSFLLITPRLDEHLAKLYFRAICPNLLSMEYLGEGRFSITYEV